MTDPCVKKLIFEQKIVDTMVESLQREEFLVYLQPKVAVDTSRIIGAEALIRWKTPRIRNDFSCRFYSCFWKRTVSSTVWIYLYGKRVPYAPGLEKERHHRHSGFRKCIQGRIFTMKLSRKRSTSMITAYGLSPEELHLEITESAYVQNSRQLPDAIRRLKEWNLLLKWMILEAAIPPLIRFRSFL